MSAFLCYAGDDTTALTASERRKVLQCGERPQSLPSIDDPYFVACAGPAIGGHDQAQVVQSARYYAIGTVRLANRGALQHHLADVPGALSDLGFIVRLLEQGKASVLDHLVGEFAFVTWDRQSRTLTLARDALGVAPLFYRENAGGIRISTSAMALADGDRYDLEYIAEWMSTGANTSHRTIFDGVGWAVPGTRSTWHFGRWSHEAFWSPDAEARSSGSLNDAADEFRSVFADAIRFCHGDRPNVWAALSGGLDSSSVVSYTQHLVETGRMRHGLAGTLSERDSLGEGDETRFSDEVVKKFGVSNEVVTTGWLWKDFSGREPLTDLPVPWYPHQVSVEEMSGRLFRSGAHIYLTGIGADHLMGNENSMTFLADLLGRGRLLSCTREAMHWSVVRRSSLWTTLWRQAVYPNLPVVLRKRYRNPLDSKIQSCVRGRFRRQYRLDDRVFDIQRFSGSIGHKYSGVLAMQIKQASRQLHPSPMGRFLATRHPFLYQPLVDYVLSLPVSFRVQPRAAKFILRESMRGILPERIRTRTGKGGSGARSYWSLSHEARQIGQLVENPILAELGVVNPERLRRSVEKAQQNTMSNYVPLLHTLALETWLRVRSGLWVDVNEPDRSRLTIGA